MFGLTAWPSVHSIISRKYDKAGSEVFCSLTQVPISSGVCKFYNAMYITIACVL